LALQEKEREIERGSLLAKGIKLIVDGTTIEEVEQVIAQDIQSSLDRNKKSAAILRRAADIAPAMGLIGTLIGLVQMLSSLDKPGDIGPFMAVALLTTLYGALLAYMVLTPLASKIERNSDEQFLLNKIYLIALVCIGKQESPRKLERLINTVLPPSKKLKTFKEE
jgi:chemotaxis protein MotA